MIATFLDGLWASLPGWIAIFGGLLGLALFVRADRVRKNRHQPAGPRAAAPQPKPVEAPQSKTELALQELARAPDLQSMQARAAEQIDAAEHALNRLLAECAGIANLPVEPTLTPDRQLKPEAPAPARQSLAA